MGSNGLPAESLRFELDDIRQREPNDLIGKGVALELSGVIPPPDGHRMRLPPIGELVRREPIRVRRRRARDCALAPPWWFDGCVHDDSKYIHVTPVQIEIARRNPLSINAQVSCVSGAQKSTPSKSTTCVSPIGGTFWRFLDTKRDRKYSENIFLLAGLFRSRRKLRNVWRHQCGHVDGRPRLVVRVMPRGDLDVGVS